MRPPDPAVTADLVQRVSRLLHEACLDEWAEQARHSPDAMLTMHTHEAHLDRAATLVKNADSVGLYIAKVHDHDRPDGWFVSHRCGGQSRDVSFTVGGDDGSVFAMCPHCGETSVSHVLPPTPFTVPPEPKPVDDDHGWDAYKDAFPAGRNISESGGDG